MASLAALAWSSGTWYVEKRESGSALDDEGRATVNGSAKDTVARAKLLPSRICGPGADITCAALPRSRLPALPLPQRRFVVIIREVNDMRRSYKKNPIDRNYKKSSVDYKQSISNRTGVGGNNVFHLLIIVLGGDLRGGSTANFESQSAYSMSRPRVSHVRQRKTNSTITQKWWGQSSSSWAEPWAAWTASRVGAWELFLSALEMRSEGASTTAQQGQSPYHVPAQGRV